MSSFTSQPKHASNGGGLGVRDITLLILVLLAIAGVAIMDFKPEWGFWYWISMVPVFGGLSIFLEWRSQHRSGEPRPVQFLSQVLHWLATALGICVVFLIEYEIEEFTRVETGYMALLILSLSTILIGIHNEWRLSVIGLLLMVTLGAAVVAEKFFWVMLVLAVVAVWLIRRRHGR